MKLIDILCWLSAAGALVGAGCYIYGYILHAKGTRRWHTASLLFSGFGLANLPIVLRGGAQGPNVFNGAVLVAFLLLGMGCQAMTAFRGRRGDRRIAVEGRPAETVAGPVQAEPAAGAAQPATAV
jgi:hypothetical protein